MSFLQSLCEAESLYRTDVKKKEKNKKISIGYINASFSTSCSLSKNLIAISFIVMFITVTQVTIMQKHILTS